VHNIANYSFAIGLYALGLGGWQILLSLGIGAALVYFFMNLSGYMGQKTGVPFPVISRISFGIHGAQIPALIRAVIAIAWFGIQTYLASVVFRVLLTAIHPGSPITTTTRSSACRAWAGCASWRSGSCNWRSSPTAWRWCAVTKPLPGR
jgi:cytosine/uracil/thiamine/allantoin permease